MSTYSDAISYLIQQAPMFQQLGAKAYSAGLVTSYWLDERFCNPHRRYYTIHIAGTNGKGSTSHLIASALQAAGYKVGLYTSPHLKDFRERIRVNGVMISEKNVVKYINSYKESIEDLKPSFFEVTTSMAFRYFADQRVDIAVIETGLGGRIDCTNIISPILSVITNVSLDHTDILGDTIEEIAREKAGVIKPHTPVVIGETHPQSSQIFTLEAEKQQSRILFADHLPLTPPTSDLRGRFQDKNIQTAYIGLKTIQPQFFHLTDEAIRKGFSQVFQVTGLQGRWQTIGEHPTIICDTGHNEAGIKEVVAQLEQHTHKHLHIVIGVVSDKKTDRMLALLPKDATYYFTQAQVARALPAENLERKGGLYGLEGKCYPTVAEALEVAKQQADEDDLIFVGGSNFVVGEII